MKDKLALSTPADCVVPVLYTKPPEPPSSAEIADVHVRKAVEAATENGSKGFVILEDVYEACTYSMLCLRQDRCYEDDCRRCKPIEKMSLLLKAYTLLVSAFLWVFRLMSDTRCQTPECGKDPRACWKEHALPNFHFRVERARAVPCIVYRTLSDESEYGFKVEAIDASQGNQLRYKFRISWR